MELHGILYSGVEFMEYTGTLLVTEKELENRKDTGSVENLDQVVVLVKQGVEKENVRSILRDKYGYTTEEVLLSGGTHGDTVYLFSGK